MNASTGHLEQIIQSLTSQAVEAARERYDAHCQFLFVVFSFVLS